LKYQTMLYMGAFGAILAVLGGFGAQSLAGNLGLGSTNLTSVFMSGSDTGEMADRLSEALPTIREQTKRGKPYAVLQLAGYVLFSVGFLGVWRLTSRTIGLVASICFLLLGIVTLVTYLITPTALEELVSLLREVSSQGKPSTLPTSLMLLAAAGFVSLVGQMGGTVSGGFEIYRIGKEMDHDFLRGSGVLLMAGAVAVFIPLFGVYIVYLGVALAGISLFLLGGTVGAALEGVSVERAGKV